jgi:hypothetical protein
MISFLFAGACLAGTALLFSQSTAPRTGDAVIHVSVDLVEVDALVTDSKGRHAPDLKPEDFTILEDGKPAVRDDATGKVGSAYTFLAVPGFNRQEMSLSSLVLGDPAGSEAQVASRKFAVGGQLSYGCQLFGVRTGPGSAVEIEVKLFREGPAGIRKPAHAAANSGGHKGNTSTGKLNLTSQFAPGEYAMEFIAHDRQASIERRAWMDFSIAAAE